MSRALTLVAGWALLFLATPGGLFPNGSLSLAILGAGLVGSAMVRPVCSLGPAGQRGSHARRVRLLEWALGGLGATSMLWWVYFVAPPALLFVVLILGFYQCLAGMLMRRLASRLPIALAVALGWWAVESLRSLPSPPLGLGWLQLGHHSSHHLWLAGSARVWGLEGLNLLAACLAGALAQVLVERRLSRTPLWLAAAPLLTALSLASLSSPGPMVPGPTALVVQPGLTQSQKSAGAFLQAMQAQTLGALESNARAGGPQVDFVAWGESMLPLRLAESGVAGALERGLNLPAWRSPLTSADLAQWALVEETYLREPFLQRLPEGTQLLTGVEVHDVHEGGIERFVGTALFGPEGRVGPVAKKRNLVPGGETLCGFERFAWARELVQRSIGYTPDFQPGTETGILQLASQDGRDYRIAAMACFDNAFLEPALEALVAGPTDFFVVTSNEAWYHDACEMDQMLAFSRVLVLSTGRSLLRVTNSGVSALLGPDGRELGRLRVGERDRSVEGELLVTIPVPQLATQGAPPYASLRPYLRLGMALFLGALLWICRPRTVAPA